MQSLQGQYPFYSAINVTLYNILESSFNVSFIYVINNLTQIPLISNTLILLYSLSLYKSINRGVLVLQSRLYINIFWRKHTRMVIREIS